MEFSKVIGGASGFETAGFAKTVVLNQIGFDLQRAAFQKEQKDTPVADAAAERELREALGDNGLPTATRLNLEGLTEAYGAAFILTTRHCNQPHPETGRKPEHLVRYLKQPSAIVQAGIDYRLERQMAQIKATALMLNADPTKRIAAIKVELAEQAAALVAPINKAFIGAVKKFRDLDDDALIDVCVEAMSNAGRNVAQELKRAAQALIDSQKKRFEEGGFAQVDAGIYALAGVVQAVEPTPPVTPPVAPQA